MLLNRDCLDSVINLMREDPDWLASEDAAASLVAIALIFNEFVPNENTALGDLDLEFVDRMDGGRIAAGAVLCEIVSSAGARPGFRLVEPVGGFAWTAVDPLPAPFTVYGLAVVVLDAGGDIDKLLACGVLAVPLTVTQPLQTVQASSVVGYCQVLLDSAFAQIL